jgi:carbon-monoxide dehydrogenase large subunit
LARVPDSREPTDRNIRWTGQPLRRREDERLLRGVGRYVTDVLPVGCLHLVFLRSPYAQAGIRSIDADAARGAPDVVAVLTAADLAAVGQATVNPLVPGVRPLSFEPLASQRVMAVGQPVAAIIATSVAAALDAADLVAVDYAPHDGPVAPGEERMAQRWTDGDVEAGFRAAATVVRVTVQHSRVAAMPLEPRAAVAAWDGDAEQMIVWLPTQSPHRARDDLAAIIGIAPDKLRVVAPDVGGAFGAKASIHAEDAVVALAAWQLRRPVRWSGSRGEDLLAGTHGRGGALSGEMALAADGTILALRAGVDFPLGHWMPYSAVVPARNAARVLPGPYRVPAVDIAMRGYLDHRAPLGIYRGAGRPEAAMLMERLLDAAAQTLQLDPLDLRRRNLIRASDLPWRTPTGQTLDSGDFEALLDRVQATAGYEALRRRQSERRAGGELVGIGLALFVEPCGEGWESAELDLAPDGTIRVATGSTAQGQGRETAVAQLVADALYLPPARILVRHGDTATTPRGIGALASRSTPIGGSALLRAADTFRAKAAALVAQLLQAEPTAVTFGNGVFLDRSGGRAMDWAALAAALAAEAGTQPLHVALEYRADGEAWSSGCCLAALSIDRETGVPCLESLHCVDDIGTVVNPLLVEGQLVGGIAQGIGEALLERIIYDAHGQLLTGSLMDYAMPRAQDMPPIALAGAHTRSPLNLLGAKGVGEAGCIGAPAAIVNAAVDALAPLGVRHLDMPLTPETLWRTLHAAGL